MANSPQEESTNLLLGVWVWSNTSATSILEQRTEDNVWALWPERAGASVLMVLSIFNPMLIPASNAHLRLSLVPLRPEGKTFPLSRPPVVLLRWRRETYRLSEWRRKSRTVIDVYSDSQPILLLLALLHTLVALVQVTG